MGILFRMIIISIKILLVRVQNSFQRCRQCFLAHHLLRHDNAYLPGVHHCTVVELVAEQGQAYDGNTGVDGLVQAVQTAVIEDRFRFGMG
jgi:hypothetical protein